MPYERRSGQRHAVQLSVELHHPGSAIKVFRVQNLAPEGMLLTNNSNVLNIDSPVELRVSWNEHSWTIPAIVTHCNNNCIGVMFSQRQSELYRTVTQPATNFTNVLSGRHSMTPKPPRIIKN